MAGGDRMRSLGLVLAVFALLCQSLVLLLPQSAMAMSGRTMPGMSMAAASELPDDAALFPGGYLLCLNDDAPAADHDKAPMQQCVDCPLCQAFHIGTGFVPPTLPVLFVPSVQDVAFAASVPRPRPLRLIARAHQPRAPPLVSSL